MTPCMMVHMDTTLIRHLTDVDAILWQGILDQGSFDPAEVDLDRLRTIIFTETEDGYIQREPIDRSAIVLSLV